MRSKELDETVKALERLLSSTGSGLVHDAECRAALRELKKAHRGGGKDGQRRLVRAINIIGRILVEQVLTEKAKS